MPVTAQGAAQTSGTGFPVQTLLNGTVVATSVQAFGFFETPNNIPNQPAADQVKDTLLAAGWTLIQTIQAVGGVSAPFGWGYVGAAYGPLLSVTYGIVAIQFAYYNPAGGPPPFEPGVSWVATGTSSGISQTNLVNAINGELSAVLTAVADSPFHITLTATPPGTLGNNIVLGGFGSVSITQNPTGGGWKLKSRSQF